VQIIAAYVHPDGGRIVVPPPVVAPNDPNVVFGLTDVSKFRGIAMNWGDDEGDDFVLDGSSAAFGADQTARIMLHCRDYGGFAKVTATRHGSNPAEPLQVPKDTNSNWIADAGWILSNGTPIADAGSNTDDSDQLPETSHQGDGLTRFEEYRGFVVQGTHSRTNPGAGDLFIFSELDELLGDAPSMYPPIAVHRLLSGELALDRSINFNYTSFVPNGDIPGHYINPQGLPNQYALRITEWGYNPGVAGETSIIVSGPFVPGNVEPLRIFKGTIRFMSPTINDSEIPEQPIDEQKTNQTIGHEVGHAISLTHWFVNNQCPPPFWTVMVTQYFFLSTTMNCNWSNIPHDYLAWKDFPTLRLK
jgi:hypothetical protein